MNLRNRSLSTWSALAVGLALTGGAGLCAGCAETSRQSQASAPAPAAQQAAPSSEYGAAMGQPSSGPSTGPTGPGMTGPSGTAAPGSPEYPESQPAPAPPTPGSEYAPPSAAGPNTMPYNPGAASPGPGQGGAPSGPSGAISTGPMDVSGYDDAQLAAIVQAVNMGEMQAAQLAENRATSPEVRRFAKDMETEHRDMQSRANAVFSRSQMTPSENPISARLKSEGQSQLSNLQSMRGKEFDRAYIEEQVRDHNSALELIDRMIADAKSPELKAELENMRPKVEAHLRKAEGLQQMLMTPKGTTNKQRGTNPY